jgi:hypothetical protein
MQRLCNAFVPPLCRLCNGSLKKRYIPITYMNRTYTGASGKQEMGGIGLFTVILIVFAYVPRLPGTSARKY